ncbi:MAG: hypothetical protein SVM79_00140 [Chloroflexota bacterium]|nr:hypothetical protein [Chloroflexota bacterium]
MKWTKEHCGLSHLGEFSICKLWVTVERFDDCAKLLKWFPGCQFSPEESWHKTVDDAKKAGEVAMGILKLA